MSSQDTRERLRKTLIELSSQKGFADITVTDVARHAEVSRKTFYQYYQDLSDLMFDCYFAELLLEGEDIRFSQFDDKAEAVTWLVSYYKRQLEFSRLNPQFPLTVFSDVMKPAYLSKFAERNRWFVQRNIEDYYDADVYRRFPVSPATVAGYIVAGSQSITKDWIDGGMLEPVEAIALRLALLYLYCFDIYLDDLHDSQGFSGYLLQLDGDGAQKSRTVDEGSHGAGQGED